jgi:hypothetical protein
MDTTNKPVAWTDHIGGFVDYGDDPNYPHPLYSHETVMDLLYEVAKLKAHPAKTLTDEEILEIAQLMFVDTRYPNIALNFARVILKKASEK